MAIDPRRRRSLVSRVETLLTDTGYVDFVIRPALELTIVENDSDISRDVDFSWKITDFTPDAMKIKLDFAAKDAEKISAIEPDSLVLTFWQGDLFKLAENGEPMPNGFKIRTELPQ